MITTGYNPINTEDLTGFAIGELAIPVMLECTQFGTQCRKCSKAVYFNIRDIKFFKLPYITCPHCGERIQLSAQFLKYKIYCNIVITVFEQLNDDSMNLIMRYSIIAKPNHAPDFKGIIEYAYPIMKKEHQFSGNRFGISIYRGKNVVENRFMVENDKVI